MDDNILDSSRENNNIEFENSLRKSSIQLNNKETTKNDSPGNEYNIFEVSEELLDKLKILEYENEFVRTNSSFKRIHKYYFVKSTNTGEQFFLFTNMAAWLIQKSGENSFEMPQEFDDPNITIGRILSQLKKFGITETFQTSKLKSGSGEMVIQILDLLSDFALNKISFNWSQIEKPIEDPETEDVDGDDAELVAEQFESDSEEAAMALDNDDNAVYIDLDATTTLNNEPIDKLSIGEPEIQKIRKSETNIEAWKEEVERALPQLKITLRSDITDWRTRLDQMEKHFITINDYFEKIKPSLKKISESVSVDIERIDNREKHLNSQVEPLLLTFRQTQDRLSENTQQYKALSTGLTQRSDILSQLTEEIDQLKQQVEEQGSKNTDGAPMIRIKQAISKLENDIVTLNVQIAIIEQQIIINDMNDRKNSNLVKIDLF
uniref:Intraflagellar transport protein 57 homolog n=1 Tax=Strongyloides papillosus TaxID=174720 RepID=A0A0N5CH10_STREA